MPQLRIVPHNLHDDATVTGTGTAVSGFPVTYTQNTIRGRSLRITGSSYVIKGTLAGTRSASFVGLFRHTIAAGATVTLELFSDAAWTTSVYDSTALDIESFTDDSSAFDFGLGSSFSRDNVPFVHWFAPTDFRSYEITLASISSPEVNRAFLGLGFEFDVNPDYGAPLSWADNVDSNRTLGGSLRRNAGEQWRALQLELNGIREPERQLLMDLMQRNGTSKDLVLSLFPEDATLMEAAYTLNGVMSSLDPIGRQISRLTKRLAMQEV